MNELLPMLFVPLLAAGIAYHTGLRHGARGERRARLLASDWLRMAADKATRVDLDPETLRFCAAHLTATLKADERQS